MKNMVYCFICNLLLIALIILTSCGRQSEAVEVVPAPIPMEQEEGGLAIDENTCISLADISQNCVTGKSQ